MRYFNAGPPGGRHLPPFKIRLSDLSGGPYGPGASVAPISPAARRSSSGTVHQPATPQEWADVLELYRFHADHGDTAFMFRLGRIYYQGLGGVEPEAGRDFPRALKWFMRIARNVWPRDPPAALKGGIYVPEKDTRVKPADDEIMLAAGLAAGYLGRMHLRGEGVAQNFSKALLWFSRGVTQASSLCHVLFRDRAREETCSRR
jgi:SEL1 protein